MTRLSALTVAIAVSLFACPPVPVPAQEPDQPPDGALSGPEACAPACANLARLGCDVGKDPDCVPACQNVETIHQDEGSSFTLHPGCLAAAKSCAEADRCNP